jgi:hypothetical protein
VGGLAIMSERLRRSEKDSMSAEGLNGRSGESSLQEDFVEEQSSRSFWMRDVTPYQRDG